MTAAGVRFLEAPRREPYGSVAVFEDLSLRGQFKVSLQGHLKLSPTLPAAAFPPIPCPAQRSPAGMLSRFDIADLPAAPQGVIATACAACKTMMIMTDPPGPERRRAS